MRGVLSIILIFAFVVLMFAGQQMYESDLDEGTVKDLTELVNITENKIKWNESLFRDKIEQNLSQYKGDYPVLQSKRLTNVIYKFVDFFGFAAMEGAKWSMEFGYTHPEYNYEYFSKMLITLAMCLALLAVLPLLFTAIFPALALGYLICKGIYLIYVKIKERRLKNERRKKSTKKRATKV